MVTAEVPNLDILVPGLYPHWRPNQLEVIHQVQTSEKKFIAIQAPPGFGKSASAIGSMVVEGGRGLALTQTKQLGDQYYRDFYPIGLKTVKGRGNFHCTIVPEKTADIAPCVAGMKCPWKRGGCKYYDQKREATEAEIASMNVFYFLYEANYGGEFSGVQIMFIDEAQKLDSVMQSFIEIRLSKARFYEEGLPIPQNPTIANLQEWADVTEGTVNAELEQILEEIEENPQNDILVLRGIHLKAASNSLDRFKIVDDTWILEEDDRAVILKPVWVGKYMDEFLFSHAEKVVLMSATLPRSIVEGCGITDYDYINLPSSFAPENRPVIWVPAANLARSAANPELEMKKLVRTIDTIADKFSNAKGIIHTVNYRITKHILQNSKHSNRMMTHTNALERSAILEQFKKTNEPAILVSPSFTEGVDLPYDQCRWQVIAKIPYADLGNKQVRARMQTDNEWYATLAIVTLVQAYGRIMRAEDDSGVTYILDSSLMNLINRWRTAFSQIAWFLDALWISKDSKLIPFKDYQN